MLHGKKFCSRSSQQRTTSISVLQQSVPFRMSWGKIGSCLMLSRISQPMDPMPKAPCWKVVWRLTLWSLCREARRWRIVGSPLGAASARCGHWVMRLGLTGTLCNSDILAPELMSTSCSPTSLMPDLVWRSSSSEGSFNRSGLGSASAAETSQTSTCFGTLHQVWLSIKCSWSSMLADRPSPWFSLRRLWRLASWMQLTPTCPPTW